MGHQTYARVDGDGWMAERKERRKRERGANVWCRSQSQPMAPHRAVADIIEMGIGYSNENLYFLKIIIITDTLMR